MFYRKCRRTAGYISVHLIFDHFVYFFKAKYQSSQFQRVFGRDMLNKYNMISNSKIAPWGSPGPDRAVGVAELPPDGPQQHPSSGSRV